MVQLKQEENKPGCDVRSDEDFAVAGFQIVQGLLTITLLAIAVNTLVKKIS